MLVQGPGKVVPGVFWQFWPQNRILNPKKHNINFAVQNPFIGWKKNLSLTTLTTWLSLPFAQNSGTFRVCIIKYRQTGERMVTLDLRKHIYCIFPRGIQIWGQKWQNPPGSLRVVALNEHFWWFLVFFCFFSATIAINRLQDTNSHAIWWQPMSRNVFWLIWTIKCPVGRFQGPLLSIFQFFCPFDGSLDTTNCSFLSLSLAQWIAIPPNRYSLTRRTWFWSQYFQKMAGSQTTRFLKIPYRYGGSNFLIHIFAILNADSDSS